MSLFRQCDRCGKQNEIIQIDREAERSQGWEYLGRYDAINDQMRVYYDLCPACVSSAEEYFKLKPGV